jgi:hypothetical protein
MESVTHGHQPGWRCSSSPAPCVRKAPPPDRTRLPYGSAAIGFGGGAWDRTGRGQVCRKQARRWRRGPGRHAAISRETVAMGTEHPLTATETATAAANRCHRRLAAAHNSRTIRADWGYVRPEKQTVGDQRRTATTVVNTLAKPLDSVRCTWTTLEYRPSSRLVMDGLGRCAHSYGSEGGGFESFRARQFDSLRCRKLAALQSLRELPGSNWATSSSVL